MKNQIDNIMALADHHASTKYSFAHVPSKVEEARQALRTAIEQAILNEREQCAKVCDEQHDRARTSTGAARADACAAAIRQLKETK